MTEWKKARKKPIEVEFREVEPVNLLYQDAYDNKISEIFRGLEWIPVKGEIIITLEGAHYAIPEQDFIIRGIKGELYPIKKEIFWKTYEVLEK